MDRQDTFAPASLLDPDQGIARKPIMRVHNIEAADVVLGLEHMMDEGSAHVVHFVDEIGMQVEWTPMIMNTVNPLVMRLSSAHAREDMYFVTLSFERGSQFGDMDANTANTNRMQRLPTKHCDSHCTKYRRLT